MWVFLLTHRDRGVGMFKDKNINFDLTGSCTATATNPSTGECNANICPSGCAPCDQTDDCHRYFLCFFVHSNLLSLQQEIPRDRVQHAKPCHRDAAQRPRSWVLSVNMHWQPGRWYDANLKNTTRWSLLSSRMLHMPLGAISITFARKRRFSFKTR